MLVMLIGLLEGTGPWRNLLSALADVSFVVYIPILTYEMRQSYVASLREQARLEMARKNEIYNQLIQSYVDWQKLCLQYIDLDIADFPDVSPASLTPVQVKQEQIALGILIELFEQSFLAFLDAPAELRDSQWKGWELYIEEYCKRENFRSIWKLSHTNMDARFSAYMQTMIEGTAPDSSR